MIQVKLARRSGGFKRSKKYELSRWSNYIHTEYPDSAARSKTNLPVILSMEEKRQYAKDDSYEELTTYNITESKSDESLTREAFKTKLRETSFNGNPEFRYTNQESRISPSKAAVKVFQYQQDKIKFETCRHLPISSLSIFILN